MQTFGQQLRAVRMRHGLTLKQVAEAANRSVSSVSDIEHSRRPALSPAEIERVCSHLNIRMEVDDLMKAAFQGGGTVKVPAESALEQELFVTLKRSIQSRVIDDQQIRELITGLKEQLEAKAESKGAEKTGNGAN